MVVALHNLELDELLGEREVLLVQRRRWRIAGWVLVALAIGERIVVMVRPSPPST
jgi:hypothetical protein